MLRTTRWQSKIQERVRLYDGTEMVQSKGGRSWSRPQYPSVVTSRVVAVGRFQPLKEANMQQPLLATLSPEQGRMLIEKRPLHVR